MRGKPSGSVLPEGKLSKIINWLKKRKIMEQKFGLQHRKGKLAIRKVSFPSGMFA